MGVVRHARSRGMSYVEMIAVTAITALTLTITMSLYLNAVSDAKTKECRANMQTIANLEEKLRVTTSGHAYTTTLSSLTSTGSSLPLCPDGYSYTVSISNGTATAQNGQTVPSGGLIISCGEAAHGKFAPGIDTY